MPEEVKPVEEQKPAVAPKSSSGLEQNVAGALCYVAGFVTGIVFLLIEKDNKFVRFHAMQSIIWSIVAIIVDFIPIIGWILVIVSWVYLIYKAYKNEYFKLPVIGDLADQYKDQLLK